MFSSACDVYNLMNTVNKKKNLLICNVCSKELPKKKIQHVCNICEDPVCYSCIYYVNNGKKEGKITGCLNCCLPYLIIGQCDICNYTTYMSKIQRFKRYSEKRKCIFCSQKINEETIKKFVGTANF